MIWLLSIVTGMNSGSACMGKSSFPAMIPRFCGIIPHSMSFWSTIRRDYQAVFRNDPAARNGLEVVLAYPGFHAIFLHRINHTLWNLGIPVIPRFLSHAARFL